MKKRKFTFEKLSEMGTEELSDLHDRMWKIRSVMDTEESLKRGRIGKGFDAFMHNSIIKASIVAIAVVSSVAISSKNLKITVSVKGDKE